MTSKTNKTSSDDDDVYTDEGSDGLEEQPPLQQEQGDQANNPNRTNDANNNNNYPIQPLLRITIALLILLIGAVIVMAIVLGRNKNDKDQNPSLVGSGTGPDGNEDAPSITDAPTDSSSKSITIIPLFPESSPSVPFPVRGTIIHQLSTSLYCGTKSLNQMDYRGTIHTTQSGLECQPWDEQSPHEHNRNEFWWPQRGLESNYCRNPDGESGAWCYTMDVEIRWELCDVPDCNYCGFSFDDAQDNCRSTCVYDEECPSGQACWSGTTCAKVTLPQETRSEFYYCGEYYQDAKENCHAPCPTGLSNECRPRQTCFADTECEGVDDSSSPPPPMEAPPLPNTSFQGKTSLTCGTKSLQQIDYRGTLNVTKNGRTCQPWDDQSPHSHNRNEFWWPQRGLEENYCRNPDGESGAWCYTMDPEVRFEHCDVPDCHYCGVDFDDAQTNCKSTCISNDECPEGESCFEGTTCDDDRISDTAENPNQLYCGESFVDAYKWCRKPCPSGLSNECNPREVCFANTSCVGAGDDSFCGNDFQSAKDICGIACNRGSASQCPPEQQCFANTSCEPAPSTPPDVSPSQPTPPHASLTCGTDLIGQIDYRGTIHTTASGLECQPWEDQFPHAHNRNEFWFPERGLDQNYCRNPDGESAAWCYTMDPNVRWEYCNVPSCQYCGSDLGDARLHCKSTCLEDIDCPNGESCWEGTDCGGISPQQDQLFCGLSLEEAKEGCLKPCPTGLSNECHACETCFADTECEEVEQPETPTLPPPPSWLQTSASCGTKWIKQIDYRGTLNVTANGRACQPWSAQVPHTHNRNEFWWPERGLEGNYCRNPDGELGAWCYTMDPDVRWELCEVPDCHYCGTTFQDANEICQSTCLEDNECPSGQSCWEGTTCERVPPDSTNELYCGLDFQDAKEWCRKACSSGLSNECNPQERCFADTSCLN